MAEVRRRNEESLEQMLKRWKRQVNDEMILADIKKNEAYVSKSEINREKKKEMARKLRRQEYKKNKQRNRKH